MSDSQFHRFCGHCGLPIPWERSLKAITSKTKVFFCRDLCRFADANAKNRAAKQLRQENPNRRTCSECHGRGYTRVNGIAWPKWANDSPVTLRRVEKKAALCERLETWGMG
jgi:hypothetical protein